AVVEICRIHNAFRDPEANARSKAPGAGLTPGERASCAVVPEKRQHLANLLAEADAESEAKETGDQAHIGVHGRSIREADSQATQKRSRTTKLRLMRIRSCVHSASNWAKSNSRIPMVAVKIPMRRR